MKMERGADYALHEDASMTQHQPPQQQSPLVHRHGRSSSHGSSSGAILASGSTYQPPVPVGAKAIDMPVATTRLMDRDPEHQRSQGRWNIRRVKVDHYWKLYLQDPFHTLVNLRLSKVLLSLVLMYVIALAFFGWLYTTVPAEECKTGISTYHDGFSFSVSVFFTIGFGTNGGDVFFGGCAWMQVIITVESIIAVFLDAVAIGLTFQRFSRAQSRANTIILSNRAVLRRVRGNAYFMFQVCEMRKHQLVEAHVRLYAIRHDIEQGQHYYFQSYPMRIQHPDDELGGMLLLALPSVVTHRLDAWSPLIPRKSANSCGFHHNPAKSYLFPEVLCRQTDAESGDRDGQVDEPRSQVSNHCQCGHQDASPSILDLPHHDFVETVKRYWRESQLEVIVLVEGIDAVTSATIQVRHSFKGDDILFDHRFVNCVDVDPETGGAIIDFKRFHETQAADPECVRVAGAFY